MKRLLSIVLAILLLLTACQSKDGKSAETQTSAKTMNRNLEINFTNLSDEGLKAYVEDMVYEHLIELLDNGDYFIENVEAIYVSKEYLEELEYNSKDNVFFGYTLEELDKAFEGKKYVFSLGEDGQTTVKEFEPYVDVYGKMFQDIATGAGVIIVCVTVSAVTGGSAPAVSVIFAASAKTGATVALSTGAIGAVSAGLITGFETKDFDESIKSAAQAAGEGFKWGAIVGAVSGGVVQAKALKGATMNGLTMNEAAMIQRESKYSLDTIKSMHSMEEYEVYKKAGLKEMTIDGKKALVQDLDWSLKDSKGLTNMERVKKGLSPIDSSGKPYELHHVGQKANSPLAILKHEQHHGVDSILHDKTIESAIDRVEFAKQRKIFWKEFLKGQ